MNTICHDISMFLLLLLLSAGFLHAQRNNMRFDRITSEQGLSDNYVLSILQDRYGFMWFGTKDGLNRYDGYRFTIYRHRTGDPGSLSDGSVNCMFEDHTGILWVGTHSGGLNRFDRERRRFIQYRHEPGNPGTIPRGQVSSICEDDEGNLWIAIAGSGAGLTRFDRRRNIFVRYRHDASDTSSLSNDDVTRICRDAGGKIWIGTEKGGLNLYDPATDKFINHHHDRRLSFDAIGSVYMLHGTPDGNLWVRSNSRMFILHTALYPGNSPNATYRLEQMRLEQMRLDVHTPNIIHYDRSGRLWLGTFLDGMYVSNGRAGHLQHAYFNPADNNSISSNRIFCICEDNLGNIWVGTDNGINKLNSRNWNFEYYQHDPFDTSSISGRVVRSIQRDSEGTLWIGTGDGGLDGMDEGSGDITHYARNSHTGGSISDNTVNEIYEDRQGIIWAGTNNGLNRLDKKRGRFRQYHHRRGDPATLAAGGIWEILEDRNGNFWIGTLGGGLNLFDRTSGKFRHYTHDAYDPASLSNNYILCMFEDRKGNIWVGTDAGLNRFDPASGRSLRFLHDEDNPNTLSNDRVWNIHEDRQGIFWIATSGGGLNRFDPATGKFHHYTEEYGLASNTVCAILEDRRGRLWISTSNGISRFDPANGIFRNFTLLDGLYISEFHFKSCHQDADGYMYFGGMNGIVRFHPDSIGEISESHRVVLTSFRVFDAEYPLDTCISLKHETRLPHDSSFFSIVFAALDCTNPLRTRYRYRLEGFDAGWRETDGTHPRADYTAIPAGAYRFQVQSAGSDGRWKGHGASLLVIIDPAFWQTWWFIGLTAMTASGIIIGVAYARIRNIRRKGELERRLVEYKLQALRAQMNPHFIFNSLNSILHFILHNDTKSAHRYLSKFSRLIRMILEHSKSESITLAEEIEALRFYIELEAVRFNERFTYDIRLSPGIALDSIRIPPMLIQPHVENAIRHGLLHRPSGGKLLIEIEERGPWILCSVEDNGIGRNRSAGIEGGRSGMHRSRGIEITRERLDVFTSLSGSMYGFDIHDLHNEDGTPSGTSVEIRIPKETPLFIPFQKQ